MSYDRYRTWKDEPLTGTPELSVVIPAYNESRRIVPTIAALSVHVAGLGMPFEVIVSDDGSTDDTVERVQALGLANVTVLDPGVNQGKGAAVRAGVQAARGRLVLFSDADLSTPAEELDGLLDAVAAGADVAIGSRAAAGADVAHKSRGRRILSAGLRRLVRHAAGLRVADTQCGFKLFTREAADRLFAAQKVDGFSFDLELLFIASRLGMQVAEVPVSWIDAPGSKVDPGKVAAGFLKDIAALRLRALRGRYPRKVTRRRAATRTGRPLRLAVVSAFPPGRNSLNEYGYHVVRHLAAKPEVGEVILLHDETDAGAPAPMEKVTALPAWRFGSLTTVARLVRAVRRTRPDAVLFNLQFASFGSGKVSAALGLLTPALLRLQRIPSVVILHNLVDTVDLSDAGFGGNPLVRRVFLGVGRTLTRVLLLADRVAVTIPRYAELLADRYGARNVFLAPHGAFDELPEPDFTPTAGPRRIMAFGKFGTYKKVDDLVAAYRRLQDDGREDLELVIAGTDSPNAAGYLESVRAANADLAGLHFTGYVAEEDVPGLFLDSAVVAFPYTSTTGSSGVLHQAGSFGRPCVLPAIGDFVEVMEEEGFTGETFTPGDPTSLAQALARLLDDPDYAEKLGRHNFAAAAGVPIADVVDWHVLHLDALAARRAA